MSLYLGADLGTSSLKLCVLDEAGHSIAQASEEYALDEVRPGWRQIDPALWLKALKSGLQTLGQSVDLKEIAAIGVTGQMHTLILADEKMAPVRPAISWNDMRSRDLLEDLKESLQKRGQNSQIPCISAGSPAASLAWLAQNEPETLVQVKYLLIGSDYISAWLTGKPVCDACMASTSGLYDLQTRQWDAEFFRFLQADPALAPPVLASGAPIGKIRKEAAEFLGLREGVQIVEGTGDNPAAALAAGLFDLKRPMLSLGTSGVVQDAALLPRYEAKGKNVLFALADGRSYCLRQGTVQACGQAYNWLIKSILKKEGVNGADAGIDPAAPVSEELFWFPHLSGEKTLYQDPQLKGAYLGLTPATGQKDLIQAMMEGIGFGFRDLLEQMQIAEDTLLLTGGGSKSAVWCQILADVLNRNLWALQKSTSPDAAMALLAGNIQKKQPPQIACRYSPNPDLRGHYDQKYAVYQKIRPALASLHKA